MNNYTNGLQKIAAASSEVSKKAPGMSTRKKILALLAATAAGTGLYAFDDELKGMYDKARNAWGGPEGEEKFGPRREEEFDPQAAHKDALNNLDAQTSSIPPATRVKLR
jgi:hypothetical protein